MNCPAKRLIYAGRGDDVKKRLSKYRREVTYLAVGVCNTAVDYLVFTGAFLLLEGLLLHDPALFAAQCLGYAAGILCSFLLNRRFTFKQEARAGKGQFWRFLLVNALTLGASLLVLELCVNVWGLDRSLTKLLFVTPVVFVVNYLLYKVFVFKAKDA